MYKVFIDDKIFYVLINASKSVLNTNIKLYQAKMFDQVFDLLKANTQPIAFTFFSKKEAQKAISKKFTWVTAAGGLVKNDQDELLLIFRNGQWDLPKGKLEKNEKNKHTAIREVEEECGISKPKIINGLKKTYHTYKLDDKIVFKESVWYEMSYKGKEIPTPQKEEGIDLAIWMNKEQIEDKYPFMYPAIKELLEEYLKNEEN